MAGSGQASKLIVCLPYALTSSMTKLYWASTTANETMLSFCVEKVRTWIRWCLRESMLAINRSNAMCKIPKAFVIFGNFGSDLFIVDSITLGCKSCQITQQISGAIFLTVNRFIWYEEVMVKQLLPAASNLKSVRFRFSTKLLTFYCIKNSEFCSQTV